MKILTQNNYQYKTFNIASKAEANKSTPSFSGSELNWLMINNFVHPKSEEFKFNLKVKQLNKAMVTLTLNKDVIKVKQLVKEVKELSGLSNQQLADKTGLSKSIIVDFFRTQEQKYVNKMKYFNKIFEALNINISESDKKIFEEKLNCLQATGKLYSACEINAKKEQMIKKIPALHTFNDFYDFGKNIGELLHMEGKSKTYLVKQTQIDESAILKILAGKKIGIFSTYQKIFTVLNLEPNECKMDMLEKRLRVVSKGLTLLAGKELVDSKKEVISLIDKFKTKEDVQIIRTKIKDISNRTGLPYENTRLSKSVLEKLGKINTFHKSLNKVGIYLNSQQTKKLEKKWSQITLNGVVPSSEEIVEAQTRVVAKMSLTPDRANLIELGQAIGKLSKLEGILKINIAEAFELSARKVSSLLSGETASTKEVYLNIYKYILSTRV